MAEITREQLADALQDAWNSYVGDTGCYPDDFTISGPCSHKLSAEFGMSNFVGFAAEIVSHRFLSGSPTPTED